MSKYLKLATHEIPFDGDTVIVTLRPLKLKHLLRFQSLNISEGERAVELFAEIMPDYVENMAGLKDAAGNPVTIQEVCELTYFAALLAELGERLVRTAGVDRPQLPGASSAG